MLLSKLSLTHLEDSKTGLGELPRTLVSIEVGNELSRWFLKQTNKIVCLVKRSV